MLISTLIKLYKALILIIYFLSVIYSREKRQKYGAEDTVNYSFTLVF